MRQSTVRSWPELVGDALQWPSLNLATELSSSANLAEQCDELLLRLTRSGERVHEDAWVIIHVGGNDLVQAAMKDPARFVGQLLCLVAPPVLQDVAKRVRSLTDCLHCHLGVRNVMLIGMPLALELPLLKKYVSRFSTPPAQLPARRNPCSATECPFTLLHKP